ADYANTDGDLSSGNGVDAERACVRRDGAERGAADGDASGGNGTAILLVDDPSFDGAGRLLRQECRALRRDDDAESHEKRNDTDTAKHEASRGGWGQFSYTICSRRRRTRAPETDGGRTNRQSRRTAAVLVWSSTDAV